MAALADLTARVSEQTGATCDLACEDPVLVEDNSTATHLYRIAQEAVTNALKHGQARHIEVRLGYRRPPRPSGSRTTGLASRTAGETAGLGLRIMRYRADYHRRR